MIDLNFKYLCTYHQQDTYKQLMVLCSYSARMFDFFYAASQDNEDDILYNADNIADIELLLD